MSNPYDRIKCSSEPPQMGAGRFLKALAQHPLSKKAAQEGLKKFREAYPEIASLLVSSPTTPIVAKLFSKQAEDRLDRVPGPVKDAEFEVIE